MTGEDIVTVSAAVVALTQLVKWMGTPDHTAPVTVLTISLFGVALWSYSSGGYARTELFNYFAAWIAIATSAAGVFGFTRATGDAIARFKEPQ